MSIFGAMKGAVSAMTNGGNRVGQMFGDIGASAGGGLLSFGLNQWGNALNAKRSYKYGEMAADNAAQRQKEYFDYTADYNTAKNQVERLKEAGLNPALMYGLGGGQGGATGAAPQGNGAGNQSNAQQAMMLGELRLKNKEIEVAQTNAETQKVQAEAAKTAAEAGAQKSESEVKYYNQLTQTEKDTREQRIIKLMYENDVLQKTSRNMDAQEQKTFAEIDYYIDQIIVAQDRNNIEREKLGIQNLEFALNQLKFKNEKGNLGFGINWKNWLNMCIGGANLGIRTYNKISDMIKSAIAD